MKNSSSPVSLSLSLTFLAADEYHLLLEPIRAVDQLVYQSHIDRYSDALNHN